MHFGLYLKKHGVITAEQLVAAIEEQLSTMVPIGQLALEEGMMSARDILNVLLAQNKSPNERFGELAIEMRLLKQEQVNRLLTIQEDRKRSIGDVLVGQGVLTEQQLQAEMVAYRHAQLSPKRMPTVLRVVPRIHRTTKVTHDTPMSAV